MIVRSTNSSLSLCVFGSARRRRASELASEKERKKQLHPTYILCFRHQTHAYELCALRWYGCHKSRARYASAQCMWRWRAPCVQNIFSHSINSARRGCSNRRALVCIYTRYVRESESAVALGQHTLGSLRQATIGRVRRRSFVKCKSAHMLLVCPLPIHSRRRSILIDENSKFFN